MSKPERNIYRFLFFDHYNLPCSGSHQRDSNDKVNRFAAFVYNKPGSNVI
jgi:hypothetical protein